MTEVASLVRTCQYSFDIKNVLPKLKQNLKSESVCSHLDVEEVSGTDDVVVSMCGVGAVAANDDNDEDDY